MLNNMQIASDAFRRGIAVALGLGVAASAAMFGQMSSAYGYGHGGFSYSAGKNCTGHRIDPIGIQFLTELSVAGLSGRIEQRSKDLGYEPDDTLYWEAGNPFDDNKGQQSFYYVGQGSSQRRICSSFTNGNATSGALNSRYHMRLHTGGASTSQPGYNVVAATPHYDKACVSLTHGELWHAIKTFDGARTQFMKNYPASRYRQYWQYVGNKARRDNEGCHRDTTVRSSGYVLFLFADGPK
jgi:hypothetical protein